MVPCPHILLVNDEQAGLYLLERAVLAEFPAALIVKSQSAEHAIEQWNAGQLDAIITDNRMPQMEGLTMVRSIREHDQLTPILMLTGSEQIRSAALEAGVNDFVSTGSWAEIRRRIRNLLAGQPGALPPAVAEQP